MASADPQSPPTPPTPSAESSASENTHEKPTVRQQLGSTFSAISDTINSNLIIIRYGTLGSIVLLGAYGIANTPLFYRYKSLWDIPESKWMRRRWIHGRIVGVLENKYATQATQTTHERKGLSSLLSSSLQKEAGGGDHTRLASSETELSQSKTQPIVILFRHSSPMERLLTQSAMNKVLSLTGKSSSRMFYSSTNPHKNLFLVELAGISHAQYPMISDGFLSRLAADKARVSIQLLAQRANASSLNSEKHILKEEGSALCHVTYRKPNQWFSSTDIALEMVRLGHAVISSSVVPKSYEKNDEEQKDRTIIINFNPTPKQLQHDAAFMSQLEEAEYAAWKSKTGIWSQDRMRALRPEYEEEERYVHNLWSTKAWNVLKKCWIWIRR